MNEADVHGLVSVYLFPGLIAFTGVCLYVFGLRPVLKQTPGLSELYAIEGNAYSALASKFSGLKQKLVTLAISGAGVLALAHDQIAPLVAQAGVDPSQILPKVPAYVWPIATMAVLWAVQYFRNLADKQARANAEALLNAGHQLAAPAPGLPVTTLPSPSPLSVLPDKEA